MALLAPDPTLSREVDIPQLDVFLDIGFRFNPSPEDVITFYLPNLIAGQNPPDAVGLFHNAAVYGAQEPKDLAAQFAPVSRSSNEERYFFTTCHRIKGRVSRVAGGGTWVLQSAKNVTKKGRKIGEVKSFRFQLRKGKTNTNWLMEEYHLACYPETGDFVEPVVCRIYVSPRVGTNSAAHQESAAALMPLPPQPQPPIAPPRQVPVMIRQQLQLPAPVKRLHIVTPVITESPPCAKRMRGAILPTVASVPPPRPSQRFMAIAPPRPACAPQLPPQQPASLLTGEHHHTAPQPSVTATLDQGLVPAEDCNEPDKNDGVGMEELMRIIEEDLNVYMKSYRPVEEEDGKNGKPKEVLVLVPDNDEHDKLAKLLEDVLKEAMEEKSINDGKNELQKADEHDVPNNDEERHQ
uniref:NAC domain-containing protein n=1 Tax=Leersia perrieri TaxID=77586 RepID=A0A0D9XYU1_9ORYZ